MQAQTAKRTERDVPEIFHNIVKGYIVTKRVIALARFILKSMSGLPLALNKAPPVPTITLITTEIVSILNAGTIFVHFSPRKIYVNSGPKMKTYITFGQAHVHSVNGKTFDKDCVAVIEAENESAGREKAFKYFGPKWHQSYSEKRWKDSLLDYFPRGLIQVEA